MLSLTAPFILLTIDKLTKEDLQAFDLIVCMDAENYQDVKNLCGTPRQCQKLRILLRDYLPAKVLTSAVCILLALGSHTLSVPCLGSQP